MVKLDSRRMKALFERPSIFLAPTTLSMLNLSVWHPSWILVRAFDVLPADAAAGRPFPAPS